jgi:hypothetical protein
MAALLTPALAAAHPTGLQHPDFASPVFAEFVRDACPAVVGVCTSRTSDEVIANLERKWDAQRSAELAAWNTWRTAMDHFEAAELGKADAEAEAAVQQARTEKHAKAPEPSDNATVPAKAPLVVHGYAAKRVAVLKYVPLGYWSKPTMQHAAASAHLQGSGTEETQEVLPGVQIIAADAAPDAKICNDAILTWDEHSYTSAGWLLAMKEHNHPPWLINGFATMYMQLTNHREYCAHELLGNRIIIHYTSEVCWQFFDVLERGQPIFWPESLPDAKLQKIERRLMREHDACGQSIMFQGTINNLTFFSLPSS